MQHIINNFLQKKSQIKPKYFTEFTTKCHKNRLDLSSLPPYPASQLDVFGHDGDSLGVDGTQIGIFKQPHQVRFTGLLLRTRATGLASLPQKPGRRPPRHQAFVSHLKGTDGRTLKPQVGLEVLGDLPHQPLERQLPDEQLSRLLVATDLSQSHGPGSAGVWGGERQGPRRGAGALASAGPSRAGPAAKALFPASCLPVAVRLLHPAGRGRAFPGRLGGQLLARRFPPRRLPSGLLGSGHFRSPARGTAF